MSREEQAKSNREKMPIITAFIDVTREMFGDAKVTYASENGIEFGKPGPEGVVPCIPQPEKKKGKK